MDAEMRTQSAITCTRYILQKALDSPFTMTVITLDDLNPEHLQDKIYEILCYLEKTKHKKVKTEWAKGLSKMEPEAK
ncbi:unnamed protein product, partial [marine sediment metagenome]